MAVIRTKITISRFDKDHRLLERREQLSRSWVRHLFDILYIMHGNFFNTLAGITDVGGAGRTMLVTPAAIGTPNLAVGSTPGGVNMMFQAGVSGVVFVWAKDTPQVGEGVGIVVGSNNVAATPADNFLGTKILHGVAAGELLYGGCEIYGLSFVNPNGEFKIRRYLTNKSGGNVTIQEVGIYSPAQAAVYEVYVYCIARDVVAPAVVLANTQILEVEYTPQITV